MNAAPSAPTESANAAAWPRVKLGKVCDFVYGFPFDSSSFNAEGIGARLIRIRDVVPGVTKTFTTQSCPPQYQVHDGDLLVGMDGDFNLARWKGGEAVLNQRVCMFRPKEELLLSGYLRHSLGKELRSIWESKGFSTVKHLLNKDLQSVSIPLPPLSVQRDIVARLDAELAKADRMREGFLAIAENAAARFRAILAETFEGGEAGDSWPRVKLGEVCSVFRGGSPRPINNYLTDSPNGLNWIKIGDISPDGKFITKTAERIKPEGLRKTRWVESGDFLLSNSMSFGRPYILRIDGCIHDGWLVLKGYQQHFDQDFLYWLLRSPTVQDQFEQAAHGSTVRNLNTESVSSVGIPIPPLSVQREIVSRLDAARAECDRAEALARKGAEECAGLRAALLKEAFE